jgi:uncharacterized protein (DUF427 family)
MGLSWQQGPLSPGAIGRFLVPEPLPKRLLYAERLRGRFGGTWVADSEDVLLPFEPGRYPMAYFPQASSPDSLQRTEHTTRHHDLGLTFWYTVHYKGLCSYHDIGDAPRAAWSDREAYPEVGRISDMLSFEPDIVSVQLDGTHLRLELGQTVIPHGPDRGLTIDEARPRKQP